MSEAARSCYVTMLNLKITEDENTLFKESLLTYVAFAEIQFRGGGGVSLSVGLGERVRLVTQAAHRC